MSVCLFCSSSQSEKSYYPDITFNNKKFEYRTCVACRLVYINPLLTADDLQALYSIDYHNEFYFETKHTYEKQVALLRQYKPSGRLMDYGCGDGAFLRFFGQKNYERLGAEYNPALVEKLNTANPDIRFITIASLLGDGQEKYDVIHLGDVLEHLLNPKEIIETLKQRLLPGGVLFAEGPIEHSFNLSYFFLATYFKLRKTLQPSRTVPMRPFHVLFANRKNQKQFFERLGYKTLHYQIFEWAWPFPAKWEEARTVKQKAEYFIAKLSVASSRIVKGWGNRFYYIGTNG